MGELAQPLEVKDFSGGITENILDCDPRRYQSADNFLINNDKSIRVRPPFVPMANGSAAALPWGNQRITSMFTWLNESLLVAQSEKRFAWYDKSGQSWSEISGVASNPILSGANAYAQTSFGEFQKQIILTSDGGIDPYGSYPVNLYKNSSDLWTARTAGLPRAYSAGNYTYQTLLNRCITVANALRASMILHLSDANGAWIPTFIRNQVPFAGFQSEYLHMSPDNIGLSYFQSVTFTFGEPGSTTAPPTPAPVASDVTSLYALVGAMNSAYTLHIADAIIGSYNENPTTAGANHLFSATANNTNYHWPIAFIAGVPPIKGPHAPLTNTSTPAIPTDTTKLLSSLTTVAAQLDDLNQKWYWHQLSINTHDRWNQYMKMNRHMVDQATIGTVLTGSGAAIITPDYTDFYNYVNNLVTIWNGHTGQYGPHTQMGNAIVGLKDANTPTILDPTIYLPSASDEKSAYLTVYWLRALYHAHYLDASVTDFYTFTCDATTAASKSVPNPVFPATGVVATAGMWVFNNRIDTGGVFNSILNSTINTLTYGIECLAAQVTAVSTNWTLDRSFLNSGYTKNFQISSSKYHSYNVAGALGSTTTAQTAAEEILASGPTALGSNLPTWMALALELFNALGSHAFNTDIHASNADLAVTLPPVPVYQVNVSDMWNKYSIQRCSPAFFIPEVASYSYAFAWSYAYNVGSGGIQYTVRSNPVLSGVFYCPTSLPVGATIDSQNTVLYPSIQNATTRGVAVSVLPQIINTNETNYDISNIKIEVYRTIDTGTSYYLNYSATAGVTSYIDTANDSSQVGNFGAQSLQTSLYTNGGVAGSDPPPKSRFVHILNGTAYYAGIYDSGQFFPNRIRQSVQLAPEWAPASFTDDLDDEITCLTSAKDNLIAGCKNSAYRSSGGFTSAGQGAMTHERFSDTIGFLNAKSAVKTEIGVFFAGNDGFYYTDGYQLIKISLELDRTYQTFIQTDVQRAAIYGAYDKTTRRVWWSLRASPNDSDNSVFYIFYLNYGVKPSGVFTTASNYPYLRPSSHVFMQGTLYYGHENGYVLLGDDSQKQDYVVSTSVSPTSWTKTIIPYNFISGAMDMGTSFKRKFMTKFHMIGNNIGNAAVQIKVVRDKNFDGAGASSMVPVNYVDNQIWGTPTIVWGDATQVWNNTGKIDVMRRFPQTSMRADYMQVQMVPAKVAVYATSVGYPVGATVVVDAVAKTATIQTPSGYTSITFMPDVVGYYLALQNDGYVLEYSITALDGTSKIITYADASNTSVSGTNQWVIRGYKKEQRLELSSYIIHYLFRGDKVTGYPGAKSNAGYGNGGENPT